jgi:hypothetical protein
VFARINETVREMDKLGIYTTTSTQATSCATNGDNVTVHIIDLDEVSELCLMWHVQINFLIAVS